MKLLITIAITALAVLSCVHDGCKHLSTTCVNDDVYLCNNDRDWVPGGDDCSYFEEKCCMVDGDAMCENFVDGGC